MPWQDREQQRWGIEEVVELESKPCFCNRGHLQCCFAEDQS